MVPDAMILVFWMLSLSQLFHSPLSPSSRDSLVPLHFLSVQWYHLHICQFSSVQFSLSVMSDSLRPHEPQHARLPCPSSTPGVHSNPYPLSRWCHPTIPSSVVPYSFCPQSFPVSGAFPMSQLFAWGGQNIGVSDSTSVLPMNTQDWFPLGWTGWISLQSKGLSSLLQHRSSKHQFFCTQPCLWPNSSHQYRTTEKIITLTIRTFLSKVMSLFLICCLGL